MTIMKCSFFRSLLVLFWLGRATDLAIAGSIDTSVAPRDQDKFKSAEYRLWLPDGVGTVRALIVKQHGCGRNGLAHANDAQWQALAKKWDCALLGSWLQPASSNCADWFQPDNGSGDAFLSALRMFSRGSQHPELETVPWVLWGHSGGANWSVYMAAKYPDRVAAVFAQSGGKPITNYAALDVPMIFNRGVDDLTNVITTVDAMFNSNRRAGALWALAINPKAKHDCHNGRQLAIPFFDTLLGQRLSVAPGKADLKPVDKMRGWLGDLTTFEVVAETAFKGANNKAVWLPTESLARAWQEFMKTGAVTDRTPPPAPTNVQLAAKSEVVHLRWSADADLETGIKLFTIYRDGIAIGSTSGPTNTVAKGNFQAGNYGDEAEPTHPEMFYIDSSVSAGRHSYQITTVNWADLESPKSVAVEVRP